MKGFRILSLVAGLVILAAFTAAIAAEVPRKAGEFVIQYPGAAKSQDLLSEKIKGKKVTMLAFISTTCPHCQTLAQTLSKLQAEYGSKGFQAMMVAYDPDATANLARFRALYANGVPVGVSQRDPVHNFLQISMIGPSYVPKLVVIDSKGMIREQYNGGDAYFAPEKEHANLAKSIQTYLK
jgi:thiol-disulfide isomerase/thioredoxin